MGNFSMNIERVWFHAIEKVAFSQSFNTEKSTHSSKLYIELEHDFLCSSSSFSLEKFY